MKPLLVEPFSFDSCESSRVIIGALQMQAQENEDGFGGNFRKNLQVRRGMQQQRSKWGVTPGDIRDPSGAAPNGNEASGVLLEAMPISPTSQKTSSIAQRAGHYRGHERPSPATGAKRSSLLISRPTSRESSWHRARVTAPGTSGCRARPYGSALIKKVASGHDAP